MENKIRCPMCFGSGKIPPPKVFGNSVEKRKVDTVKRLREKGYSLRAIAKLTGYKNMNSIRHILKQLEK